MELSRTAVFPLPFYFFLASRAAAWKRVEEKLAVALGFDAGVEDDDDAAIRFAADEAAKALLELDDGLGDGVFHEWVAAPALDGIESRFDDRLIGDREGELDDDYVAELIPLDVDPLPETAGAQQNGVGRGAESLKKNTRRRALALHEHGEIQLFERPAEPLAGGIEHAVAGEQDERPAAGLFEIVNDA